MDIKHLHSKQSVIRREILRINREYEIFGEGYDEKNPIY